jgi:hypothetical protein
VKRREPFQGRVRIGRYSSLRKLMRAANRGRVPEERLFTINQAMRSAFERKAIFHTRHNAGPATLAGLIGVIPYANEKNAHAQDAHEEAAAHAHAQAEQRAHGQDAAPAEG